MLDRLATQLADHLEEHVQKAYGKFETAHFNDPLADQLDWTPLFSGGNAGQRSRLVEVSLERIEFRAGLRTALMTAAVFLLGASFIAGGVFFLQDAASEDFLPAAGLILFGLLIVFATVFGGYAIHKPRVLDRENGAYWVGRLTRGRNARDANLRDYTPLHDIHALQLIQERFTGDELLSFELNIVRHDGRRVRLTGDRNLDMLRSQAATTATFLRVPLWDMTRPPPAKQDMVAER